MNPDPRWLQILKASGWQTFAIALACGLFLLAESRGLMPPAESIVKQSVIFLLLISGCLALTSIFSNSLKFFGISYRIRRYAHKRKEQKTLEEYIPYMTDHERIIIGYLLEKNLKTITAESDGGYASTLLSRGIIRPIGTRGQHVDLTRMPMAIPNHYWDILVKNREQFPYEPMEYEGQEDVEPWHIPWMVR